MSDDQRLHEMLERATAPGSELPLNLDAETASLREAWLALGRSLAAAEAAAGPPRNRVELAPPRRRALPPLVIFTLAASLMIVASVAVLRERGPMVADNGDPAAVVGGEKNASHAAASAIPTAVEPSRSYWEWDEQLDSEISDAAQATIWQGGESPGYSSAYFAIGQDLRRMGEDIHGGTF